MLKVTTYQLMSQPPTYHYSEVFGAVKFEVPVNWSQSALAKIVVDLSK